MVVRWRANSPSVGRVQFGLSPGVVAGSAQEASAGTNGIANVNFLRVVPLPCRADHARINAEHTDSDV